MQMPHMVHRRKGKNLAVPLRRSELMICCCKLCAWKFGDPELAHGFVLWERSVRDHLVFRHGLQVDKIEIVQTVEEMVASKPINDYMAWDFGAVAA